LRARPYGHTIYLNDHELKQLIIKTKKTGLSKSALIRTLIVDYEPKEKPDDEFYAVMNELIAIGNNVNQIAKKAIALNFIDVPYYKKEAEKWSKFRMSIKRKFLEPEKISYQIIKEINRK
jgi:hypothetical protein